ncbi:MAG: Maf family protein [Ruminococcus callidus]
MGLILASASPRRQELLRLITEDFTVFPAAVDESLPPVLSVQKAAQYLARKKQQRFLLLFRMTLSLALILRLS